MGRMNTVMVVILASLVLFFSTCVFIVNEKQKALLLFLGEIKRFNYTPGLYFKWPYPFNQVYRFDARILTLDAEPEEYLTSEKKGVVVDAFIKWRISDDVDLYYTTMSGDEASAAFRLGHIVKKGLRDEFGKRTIQEVVSGERSEIMDILRTEANQQAKNFGIELVDVRIKRIELPLKVSQSVYRRMEAERSRVAKEFRSRGAEAAEIIRAAADRERTELLAGAYRDAQIIRGAGDAQAAKIYAKAYGQNPEFYALDRRLNAYKSIFHDQPNLIIFQPDTDFFRYFRRSRGETPTEEPPSASEETNRPESQLAAPSHPANGGVTNNPDKSAVIP
jgi:membrane protease subunit HflC